MSTPREEILKQVRRWMRYGDEDLRLAKGALSLKPCPYRLAAFHAQQCAEKYLKAYLLHEDIDFAYSHNISYLLELAAEKAPWGDKLAEADRLSRFAVTLRYPGEDSRVTRSETELAISLATSVRREVRRACK